MIAAASLKLKGGAKLQWHKLHAAWQLMVAVEAARVSGPFEMVLKARFDATPLVPFAPCLPAHSNGALVVHAATDKLFWGDRASMAVTAELHAAIGTAFEGAQPSTPSSTRARSISLRRLHDAMTAVPPAAWTTVREQRQHYNKVAMIPFPRLPSSRLDTQASDPRAHTLGHVRATMDASIDAITPYQGVHGPTPAAAFPSPSANKPAPVVDLTPGLRSSEIDRAPKAFVAERDFLLWLLWHNVSVCDLGAGSDAILYKGARAPRPSMGCPWAR